MTESVTRYGIHRFGSDRARPVIVSVYFGAGGWVLPVEKGVRLVRGTAEELRAAGVTMVRVRWRFRTREVILRRYLGD